MASKANTNYIPAEKFNQALSSLGTSNPYLTINFWLIS